MEKISCRNLSFSYGKKKIFANINLEIAHPGIYALVGSNGCGKSTLLKLLLGIIPSKHVIPCKYDATSFMLDDNALYENLTVRENLIYFNMLKGGQKENLAKVLDLLDIKMYQNTKIKKLSLGTKVKASIAKTLLCDSAVYIFDEPLNGLDPKGVIKVRNILKNLQRQKKIVIISSHLLKELNDIADYIIFIDNKKLKMFNKNEVSDIETLFKEQA